MNNLECLKEAKSPQASLFSEFIKEHFIGKENRYFLFSSHLMGTLPYFSDFMDASAGSSRTTELQELPLVPSLEMATELSESLDSTREAVYSGLFPGMIYEAHRKGNHIRGKRETAVMNFIRSTTDYDGALVKILKSLIDGEWKFIPEDLRILLDSAPNEDGIIEKIRWVPFHLQYVLDQMGRVGLASFGNARLADKLAGFCNLLQDSKEESGPFRNG